MKFADMKTAIALLHSPKGILTSKGRRAAKRMIGKRLASVKRADQKYQALQRMGRGPVVQDKRGIRNLSYLMRKGLLAG